MLYYQPNFNPWMQNVFRHSWPVTGYSARTFDKCEEPGDSYYAGDWSKYDRVVWQPVAGPTAFAVSLLPHMLMLGNYHLQNLAKTELYRIRLWHQAKNIQLSLCKA